MSEEPNDLFGKDTVEETCGSTDTTDGTPCKRTAGWGTDRDHGPCKEHVDDRPVLRKFTATRRERIIGAAMSGAFKKHIAQAAEIDRDTLDRWLDMGKEDDANDLDTELAEFYTAWQRARGAGAVQTLQSCSAEFIAERTYGYTKTEKRELEHTGEGGGPLMILETDGSDTE